jgi:hypothetical protein
MMPCFTPPETDELSSEPEAIEALRAILQASEHALQLGDSIKRVSALEVIRDCAADVLATQGRQTEG